MHGYYSGASDGIFFLGTNHDITEQSVNIG